MAKTDNYHASNPFHAVENATIFRVWSTMNRTSEIKALGELYKSLNEEDRRSKLIDDEPIAFGFDTNAFFRLGQSGLKSDNSIDYLRNLHQGPLIVPGQAIQEAWNNLRSGVSTPPKRLKQNFANLTKELNSLGEDIGSAGEIARKAIEQFVQARGDWIDPESRKVFDSTLEAFLEKAIVSYVPRVEFAQLARIRKETKTPPGFRDSESNHGDFFIWADFLYGLARSDLETVKAAVLVTNDIKSDWSVDDVAHPLLVAEAQEISGLPFRLWTIDDFHKYVSTVLGQGVNDRS